MPALREDKPDFLLYLLNLADFYIQTGSFQNCVEGSLVESSNLVRSMMNGSIKRNKMCLLGERLGKKVAVTPLPAIRHFFQRLFDSCLNTHKCILIEIEVYS